MIMRVVQWTGAPERSTSELQNFLYYLILGQGCPEPEGRGYGRFLYLSKLY